MDFRGRVEAAARRAGYKTNSALAKACGVSQPAIHGLVAQGKTMGTLLSKIAEITGVSEHWLRDGKPFDAPPWALDMEDDQVPALVQAQRLILGKLGRTPADQLAALLGSDPELAAETVAIAKDLRHGSPDAAQIAPQPMPLPESADLAQLGQVICRAHRLLIARRDAALAKARETIEKLAEQVAQQTPTPPPRRSRVAQLVREHVERQSVEVDKPVSV